MKNPGPVSFRVTITPRGLILGVALMGVLLIATGALWRGPTSAAGARESATASPVVSAVTLPDGVGTRRSNAGPQHLPSINGGQVNPSAINRPPTRRAGPAASSGPGVVRRFYLTANDYSPDQATAACAPGYRMASIWELADPSNLDYASGHPDAYTQDDSGEGPPSSWNGWIRTGRNNSTANTAGTGNCAGWTSADGADYGTAVQLASTWDGDATTLSPWNANAFQCSFVGPVWCVQS